MGGGGTRLIPLSAKRLHMSLSEGLQSVCPSLRSFQSVGCANIGAPRLPPVHIRD
jgi:hypothetical protein